MYSLGCNDICKWTENIFVLKFFWFQHTRHYHLSNLSMKEGLFGQVLSYWYRISSKGWNLLGYLFQFLQYDSNMCQQYNDHPLIILPQEYLNQADRINNFFTFSKDTFLFWMNVNCTINITYPILVGKVQMLQILKTFCYIL